MNCDLISLIFMGVVYPNLNIIRNKTKQNEFKIKHETKHFTCNIILQINIEFVSSFNSKSCGCNIYLFVTALKLKLIKILKGYDQK